MADVDSFMDKFNTEYEVKWGHGYDDTLGDKIKITIVATGFGLEDVLSDETTDLVNEDDIAKAAERAAALKQKRAEEDELIGRYYDSYKSAARSVILTPEELDDEHLISLLEDNPTYNRDPKCVDRLRSRGLTRDISTTSLGENKQAPTSARQNTSRGGKTKIIF